MADFELDELLDDDVIEYAAVKVFESQNPEEIWGDQDERMKRLVRWSVMICIAAAICFLEDKGNG